MTVYLRYNTRMDEDGVIITPIGSKNLLDPANAGSGSKQIPSGNADTPIPGFPVQPPEPDSQAEEDKERIFDISPDLNISEEKTDPSAPTTPLQTVPAVTKTVPANPQPKKIGEAYGIMAEKQAQAMVTQNRKNLQEAVSTIIPEKLRVSLPDQTAKPSVPTAAAKPLDARPSPSRVPTPTLASTPAPTPPIKPPVKLSSDPNIKPLRTYEGDVAEVMSHRNISQASMAIAENKKQSGEDRIGNAPKASAVNLPTASVADAIAEADEPPSHSGRKLLLAILSLILVAGGIFGGYYLYGQSPLAAPTPQPAAREIPSSIVKAESQTTITIDGLSANAIASKVRAEMSKPQTPSSIKEIALAETQNGELVRASPSDVLNAMGIAPPDMITRTLQPQWMLGIYADASGEKSAFMLVETDFFQNAFAGMLQWEATMPFDLQPYLYAQATSTVLNGRFEDRIVKNADVREFTAADGQTPFLYSFIDNSKLIVAGNESALSEIQSRLEQQAFIR